MTGVIEPHGSTMEPFSPPMPVSTSYVAASCRSSLRQAGESSAVSPFLNSFSALAWMITHASMVSTPCVVASSSRIVMRPHCARNWHRCGPSHLECLLLRVLRNGGEVLNFHYLLVRVLLTEGYLRSCKLTARRQQESPTCTCNLMGRCEARRPDAWGPQTAGTH